MNTFNPTVRLTMEDRRRVFHDPKKLFKMCTNCNARKYFKIMINGCVEILPTLVGLEKYGDYEVYNFGVHGRIIVVVLWERSESI